MEEPSNLFTVLDAAIIYVSNITKAKNFYTNTLRFTIVNDSGTYVNLKVKKDSETNIALNADEKYHSQRGKQTIVLQTENIEEVFNYIKN